MSVTRLLSKEFPFDSRAVAEKVSNIPSSRYNGMSVDRILKMWNDSADHGNVVHDAVENYIKEDVWPSDKSLVPLVEQFSKLNFRGDLLSETLIWHEDYMVAGIADILEVFDDYIYLWDIKTSHKLDDDKLMKYSMQLEIYKRLVEKRFKKETRIGAILWFEDYVIKRSKTKLRPIQALNVEDSVDDILEKRRKELSK